LDVCEAEEEAESEVAVEGAAGVPTVFVVPADATATDAAGPCEAGLAQLPEDVPEGVVAAATTGGLAGEGLAATAGGGVVTGAGVAV